MKNKNGQALVEFVIILPVLLLIVISIIDFGSLLHQKYQLEQKLDYVSDLYIAGQTAMIEEEKQQSKIILEIEDAKPMMKIKLRKKANLSSPVLRKIFGNNYYIETSRKLYEEEQPSPSPTAEVR